MVRLENEVNFPQEHLMLFRYAKGILLKGMSEVQGK